MSKVMAAPVMPDMLMLLMSMFSTTPPRPRVVLKRSPLSVSRKTQLVTLTLRTPPDISLPITTPPCPCSTVQLRTTIFSVGRPRRRPCSSRPDFRQFPQLRLPIQRRAAGPPGFAGIVQDAAGCDHTVPVLGTDLVLLQRTPDIPAAIDDAGAGDRGFVKPLSADRRRCLHGTAS